MGNIIDKCCESINCRITIIGTDEPGKKILYEQLTKSQITATETAHYEKTIKKKGMNITLAIPANTAETPSLWNVQVLHSNGIIFVIDNDKDDLKQAKALFFDLFKTALANKKAPSLILVNNGKGINEDDFMPHLTHEKEIIKVVGCDIKNESEYSNGLNWLLSSIKIMA